MPSGFVRNGAIVIAATVAGVAALAAFLQQPTSMADSIAAARPEPARRVAPVPVPAVVAATAAPAVAQPAPAAAPPVEPRSPVASEPPKTAAAPQHVEKPVKATVEVPPAQSLELSEPRRAEPLAATAVASEPAAEKPAPRAKKAAETRKKARQARQWREDSYDVPALGYDSTGRPRRLNTRPAPFPIGDLFSRRW
jgi:outer membrane biosynthesis protein TonB